MKLFAKVFLVNMDVGYTLVIINSLTKQRYFPNSLFCALV